MVHTLQMTRANGIATYDIYAFPLSVIHEAGRYMNPKLHR